MKHRRGIDFADPVQNDLTFWNIARLREWHTMGGYCARCEREGWVDRYDVERRFGVEKPLSELAPFLRCRRCGNKGSNKWIFGKVAR